MASEAGIPAVICNGTVPGTLEPAAAGGEPGRHPLRRPAPRRASSFKLWLKYAKPAHGRLARRRRRRPGPARERLEPAAGRDRRRSRAASARATRSRSLSDGEVIGKGIANYSSDEVERIKGMKSTAGARADAPGRRRGDPPRPLRPGLRRARLPAFGALVMATATLAAMAVTTQPSPRQRRREAAARALARASTEAKNAALEATARLLEERDRADPRGQRRRPRRRARRRPRPRPARPPDALTEERIAAMAAGVRAIAALDDPVGEEIESADARERARPAQAPGAARGRRRRLRGAPERDHRLRRADDQERQRDRPARLQLRRALQRRPGRRSSARRSPTRAARGRGRAARRPAAARTSPSWRPRTASSTS